MDNNSCLIRLPEVERLTALRRSAIYARIAAGKFPPPLKISKCCSAWREDEVRAWISALPRGTIGNSEGAAKNADAR